MATIYQKLGLRLKSLRKAEGFSQEKLAELAKVTPRTVVDTESGKRNITLKTLYKLVKSLRAASSDLLPF